MITKYEHLSGWLKALVIYGYVSAFVAAVYFVIALVQGY